MARRSNRFSRSRNNRTSRLLLTFLAIAGVSVGAFAVRKWAGPSPTPLLMATENTASGGENQPTPARPADGDKPLVEVKPKPSDPPVTQPVVKVPTTKPVEVAQPKSPRVEPIIPTTGRPLEDAQKYFDAGQFAAARAILNNALVNGQLATGAEPEAAKDLLRKINEQMLFSRRVFADDPYTLAYTVQAGDMLRKLAANNDVTWELLARVNGIADPRKVRALQTLKIVKGPFHAVITKSRFTMDIYLGAPGGPNSLYVTSYRVGLGKDDSTPAGVWKAASKLKNPTYHSPRAEGIIAADDPKNPLGEFWIGLTGVEGHAAGKSSYGIHGTIEPDSIGKQASNGCIRMLNQDIALVYELLVEGKSVVVVKE